MGDQPACTRLGQSEAIAPPTHGAPDHLGEVVVAVPGNMTSPSRTRTSAAARSARSRAADWVAPWATTFTSTSGMWAWIAQHHPRKGLLHAIELHTEQALA